MKVHLKHRKRYDNNGDRIRLSPPFNPSRPFELQQVPRSQGALGNSKSKTRYLLLTTGKWSWQVMLFYGLIKNSKVSGKSMALHPYLILRYKEKSWSRLQTWAPKSEVSGPACDRPSLGWCPEAGPAMLSFSRPHVHIPLLMPCQNSCNLHCKP